MKRHAEFLLKEYLGLFPCVAILGPRQCGKTTLLHNLPKGWQFFDMERAADYQDVARDPDLFLSLHPERIAFDEAQRLPALFPALRVAIDAQRQRKGRFVLTGSSSPDLVHSLSESLAGRVAILEMSPFSLSEAYGLQPSKIPDLLRESVPPDDWHQDLEVRLDAAQVQKFWMHGGYPEPWVEGNDRFRKLWFDNYLQTYVRRDLQGLFPGLNPERYRLFLQILAGVSGSIINYSDVARTLGVSVPTAREYFRIADGTFLWRHVPAYERSALKRVVKHPKGHFRDAGLAHFLQHISNQRDLRAHPRMGFSWEAFAGEQLITTLRNAGLAFDIFHFRTGGGSEVDLVLEGDFGLVAVEVKYGQTVDSASLRALREFVKAQSCKAGMVINNDDRVRVYEERILGVPIGCL
jgi:uncharacterized protein